MRATQAEKAERFLALHARPGAFVIPNPWDAGTARILTALGFEALTTTSAGLAFALGRRDGAGMVTRDEALANARAIVDATDLPVAADLENGYGDSPEAAAETIRLAGEWPAGRRVDRGRDRRSSRGRSTTSRTRSSAWRPRRRRPAPCRSRSCWSAGPRTSCTAARPGRHDPPAAGVRGRGSRRAVRAGTHARRGHPDRVRVGAQAGQRGDGPRRALRSRSPSWPPWACGGSAWAPRLSRAALGAFVRAAREIREHGTFRFAEEAIPYAEASEFMFGP